MLKWFIYPVTQRAEHERQKSRKKHKLILTDIDDDEISDPGSNPNKLPGKPGKKKSPVKVKTEVNKDMQEAQGPDTTMTKEDQAKTSSKPSSSKIIDSPKEINHHSKKTCQI